MGWDFTLTAYNDEKYKKLEEMLIQPNIADLIFERLCKAVPESERDSDVVALLNESPALNTWWEALFSSEAADPNGCFLGRNLCLQRYADAVNTSTDAGRRLKTLLRDSEQKPDPYLSTELNEVEGTVFLIRPDRLKQIADCVRAYDAALAPLPPDQIEKQIKSNKHKKFLNEALPLLLRFFLWVSEEGSEKGIAVHYDDFWRLRAEGLPGEQGDYNRKLKMPKKLAFRKPTSPRNLTPKQIILYTLPLVLFLIAVIILAIYGGIKIED